MIYLQLIVGSEEVPGDGSILGYEGQIEIESFGWKVEAKHIPKGREEYTTAVHPKSIQFVKLVDTATPNLCKHMEAKARFATATVTMLTTGWAGQGSSHQRLVQLVLSRGYIEEVHITASESGKVVALKENLTLSYEKSEIRYFPFDAARRARTNVITRFELDPDKMNTDKKKDASVSLVKDKNWESK